MSATALEDSRLLQKVLRLAEKGRGRVSPNPLVGAVVVRDGRVVGEGYHGQFGGPHAEVMALRAAGEQARGATLYVNLEPCCHYGKTPPCTDAIIRSGVARVVVGAVDPNPLINGKGIQQLREAGIQVEVQDHWPKALDLNRGYFKWVQTGLPYVTAKAAITLDGRIATVTGSSKWITSERARRFAHRLRAKHDAVMVGKRTLEFDDPQLTVRHVKGPNPVRVVLDEDLSVAPRSRAVRETGQHQRTIVVTSSDMVDKWIASEPDSGSVKVLGVPTDAEGKLDTRGILRALAEEGITSVLVEGGAQLLTSLLREGLVDELAFFLAPKIFGSGPSVVGDLGVKEVSAALHFRFIEVRRVGADVFLRAVPS